jgi:Co/Zn/Cd efflux system component
VVLDGGRTGKHALEHAHDDTHDDDIYDQERGHEHGHGFVARLLHAVRPHSHDPSQSTDSALETSTEGTRAVRLSLAVLGVTAVIQAVVAAISGSVALLADTVHNVSDALTAVPLWVAFVLVRRPPTRRFTYGLGRVEDLAGLFVVLMIAASAPVAGWESVRKLSH